MATLEDKIRYLHLRGLAPFEIAHDLKVSSERVDKALSEIRRSGYDAQDVAEARQEIGRKSSGDTVRIDHHYEAR